MRLVAVGCAVFLGGSSTGIAQDLEPELSKLANQYENVLGHCDFGPVGTTTFPIQFSVTGGFHILAGKPLNGDRSTPFELTAVDDQRPVLRLQWFGQAVPTAFVPPKFQPQNYRISAAFSPWGAQPRQYRNATLGMHACEKGLRLTVTARDEKFKALATAEYAVILGYKPAEPSQLGPWVVVK